MSPLNNNKETNDDDHNSDNDPMDHDDNDDHDKNDNDPMDHDDNDDDDDDDDDVEVSSPSTSAATSRSSLYMRPSYFYQTRRKGKILKSVRERYLRDDLGLGTYFVDDTSRIHHTKRRSIHATEAKPETIESTQHLLSLLVHPANTTTDLVVCDTNVLLHNLDVIEQGSDVIPNLVFPQTALVECRSNRMVAYDRVVDMLLRSIQVGQGQVQVQGQGQLGQQSEKDSTTTPTNRRCCIYFPDMHHSQTAYVDDDDDDDNDDDDVATTRTTTINDENDARIRNVASFLGQQLLGTTNSNCRVILLTDDVESRRRAATTGSNNKYYQAKSVRSYVQELDIARTSTGSSNSTGLLDLVAQYGTTPPDEEEGKKHTKRISSQQLFVPHVDPTSMSIGVKSGRYYRGVIRLKHMKEAYVTIRRGEERVAVTVQSSTDLNRAIDGDVVAIELHPFEQWISSSSTSATSSSSTGKTSSAAENNGGTATTAGIASETAEPTVNELANVSDRIRVDDDVSTTFKPTGRVVGILRRNFASYSGSIYERMSSSSSTTTTSEREAIALEHEREFNDGTTRCVFFPVDTKIPPILIRTTQRERLVGQRIVVTMDSWPSHSKFPLGHYVETIGEAGSKDVETEVLLQQFKIAHEPFSASVLACLPPTDYKITMVPDRLDLRHLPVLSIDPPGCKDIDDALHCIVLPNGNYQVGVSIADVTHYVSPGSAIDIEAANRSTSTYLVNRRLDMLPALLTTDLCSLKSNVDRYAFTVLWEVTPDAEIINVDFQKTIIHSIAALTYQQAQSFIDQPDNPNGEEDAQVGAVKRLASLARKFRKKRIDAGALTLASPEVKFVLDSESLNPTDVQSYALLEANALVEEFMLLANITVAKKILRHYPTLSVLRRHPSPNRTMFEGLISKARCRGFEINIDNSKKLADSLDAAVIDDEPYFNKLLRILSTRCMSPAQYFGSGEYKAMDYHHFGLAAPVYTHFTSPIRRYADVCVHRLLAAAINVAPLPPHLSSKSYLHDLCANMNRRHRAAQLAGRASVQLHTLIFFASDSAREEDAYVLDVETADKSDPALSVIVPRYGIEGRIKLPVQSDDSNLQRYPKEHKIVYNRTNSTDTDPISIQVFDKVKVKIYVQQLQEYQRELVIELVEPALSTPPAEKKRKEVPGESKKRPSKRGRKSK